MGLLDKVTTKQADPNQLTVEELEFLLIKIKKMRFSANYLLELKARKGSGQALPVTNLDK